MSKLLLATYPEISAIVEYVAKMRKTDNTFLIETLINKYFMTEVIWSVEKEEWLNKMTQIQKNKFIERITNLIEVYSSDNKKMEDYTIQFGSCLITVSEDMYRVIKKEIDVAVGTILLSRRLVTWEQIETILGEEQDSGERTCDEFTSKCCHG